VRWQSLCAAFFGACLLAMAGQDTCEQMPLKSFGPSSPWVVDIIQIFSSHGEYVGALFLGSDGKWHFSDSEDPSYGAFDGGGAGGGVDPGYTYDQAVSKFCPGGVQGAARPATPRPLASTQLSAPAGAGLPPAGNAAGTEVVGDFNGDGIPDSASFNGEVFVYLFGPAGALLSSSRYHVSANSGVLTIRDFNGDGIQDLAIAFNGSSSAAGGVAVLLGKGDGTFGPPAYFQAGPFPISIAVADFNGDGKPDLAIGNLSGSGTPGSVSILMGKGDGTFSSPASYNLGQSPLSMVSTDFNGDGKADLAVLDTTTGILWIFLGNGDGTLRAPTGSPSGTSIGSLSYTDINRDGKQDLLIADNHGGAIAVLLGNGDGTFQSPKEYVAAALPADVVAVPLEDGDTLLLTGDGVTGNVFFNSLSPDGTSNTPLLQSVGVSPSAIAIADLNHDGKNDIVIADSAAGSLLVLLNSGNAQFANPTAYPVGSFPAALAIADVNDDGKPDLIAQDNNGFDVLLGKGDGTFGPAQTSAAAFNSPGFAIADFNSDGKPDIAFFDTNGNVSILLGNGNGTFSPGPTLPPPAGTSPASLVAGDFNADGNQDLAVAYDPLSFAAGSVTIMLGDGRGGFRSLAPVAMPGDVIGLNAADLNRDGKLDLIARYLTNQGGGLSVALGKGDGTFQAASANTTVASASGIVVADLNGDGNPDVVLTDGLEPSYLLGKGDGTFRPEVLFPSGPGGRLIAAADLDGDGHPDLAVAGSNVVGSNNSHGTLVLWQNVFSVSPPPALPVSTAPPSGNGPSQTFTFTFSDSGGWQNLKLVDVLINNVLDGRRACYIAFVPSAEGVPSGSGSLFLVDDSGDAGGPYQGLVLPANTSIRNSQCTINGAVSSVTTSGNSLTLTLAIAFSIAFAGNKVVYTSAQDSSTADSGWQALATWGIPGPPTAGPGVSGMSPGHSSGPGPAAYTFTFSDNNGWQDIAVANVLIAGAIDGRHACYLAFAPSGAASGSLFLVDDAGDAGGPFQGLVLPAASGTIGNGQCTIGGVGSTVTASGNTLTLTLNITFSPSFAGNQLFFLAARNNTANSNWQAVGSVTVP